MSQSNQADPPRPENADNGLTPAALPAVRLTTLHTDLGDILSSDISLEERLMNALKLLVGLTNAAGGVCFLSADDNSLTIGPRVLSKQALLWGDSLLAELEGAAVKARATDRLQVEPSTVHETVVMVAAPLSSTVPSGAVPPGVITLLLLIGEQPVETFATIVQLFASALSHGASSEYRETSLVEKLIRVVSQSDRLDEACVTTANLLAENLSCDRVLLGLATGLTGRCRVYAFSGAITFDRRTEELKQVEHAFAETLKRNVVSTVPAPAPDTATPVTIAEGNALGLSALKIFPLHAPGGEPSGAVLFGWLDPPTGEPHQPEHLQTIVRVIGLTLGAFQSRSTVTRKPSKRRRLSALAVVTLIAIGLCIPVPHKIAADGVVQPVKQHFVAGPFDGRLAETRVRLGELVQPGDVLAVMDERELNWQLATLVADQEKARKRGDIALASADTAGAQLAKLESERLQAQIDLLGYRKQNLRIVTPITGLVIEGDLEREEGAPVTRGQRLYEIAPLETMIVEIEIAAEEISFFREGAETEIRLDAYPDRVWTGGAKDLHPRSVIRDSNNVFIAEVWLANHDQILRPGMRGRAKLMAGSRRVGWILFHRAWERLRGWISW